MLTLLMAFAVQAGPSLDDVLRDASRDGFHGNVLVARRGEVLVNRGFGLANREAGTPFTPATLVQIGSNVKDFTRVAIYQLAERGRLSVDDSLPRFFENVPADKRGITIRHLLSHRAGIPANVSGGDNNPLDRDELLRRVFAAPLGSTPGAREVYSNAGYSVLAAIVERVSGEGFDRYVARHMLDPLGLRDIGSHLRNFDRARLAHGYAGGRDIGVVLDQPHFEDGHQYQLRGNGGYVATLADMRRFYQALRGDALLRDPAHRREVFNTDGPAVYAGSDLTSYFLFASYPGAGVEIFIASNSSEYPGTRLHRALLGALGIVAGPGGQRDPGVEIATDGPGARITSPLMERIPDTGIGRTVSAYFDAYATGDTAMMRRFITQYGGVEGAPPMETRLQRFLQMHGTLGALRIRGARNAPDGDGLVVAVTASNGEDLEMTFVVEPQPPHRLRGIRVEAGN